MPSLPARPRLAIINTSEDLVDILRTFFEEEGYEVATAIVRIFRTHEQNFEEFIKAHDPQILVWDIAVPYEENWGYFQKIKELPIMQGRRFVLTTTNEKRVHEVAGGDHEITEIVGKPFDLYQLAGVVAHTLKAP